MIEKKSTYFFMRGDNEDVTEWPVNPLDNCQSGITHSYWMNILSFCSEPENKKKSRVLVDRSPLSHVVYEFWWRRLFPILKELIKTDSNVMLLKDDVDAGWTWIRNCLRSSSRARDSLDHFKDMIETFLREMDSTLQKREVRLVVYLSYNDYHNQSFHNLADERRIERGGFDVFPLDPCEGDRTEYCHFLYAPGEALLWEQVFDTYTSNRWTFSPNLTLIRLQSNDDGADR